MPWLYRKYAGHDINRDAFMMNLVENRNRDIYGCDWHPQVFPDDAPDGRQRSAHCAAKYGSDRSNTDPVDLAVRQLLGGAMAMQLQRDRHPGVVTSANTTTTGRVRSSAPIGHNTVCSLTEVASVDIATPINVPATELRAGFQGLRKYRPEINFPDPGLVDAGRFAIPSTTTSTP